MRQQNGSSQPKTHNQNHLDCIWKNKFIQRILEKNDDNKSNPLTFIGHYKRQLMTKIKGLLNFTFVFMVFMQNHFGLRL